MKVLLTGSTGFLGQRIIAELKNFEVIKLGRDVDAHIKCDLSRSQPLLPNVEIVIHAAGKAHFVPKTELEKRSFFDTNVKGTENLLKALENTEILPVSFVFISSVAVYGFSYGSDISEDYPLLADDPYGKSKIEAEKLVLIWCKKNNVICTIFRLPLLAGSNPPGNLGSMIKGISKGYYFNIAGGNARKSIVLASDVAKIIPEAANIGGVYNLTDGYNPSFSELASLIAVQLNKSKPKNIPRWFAIFAATAGNLLGAKAPINSSKLKKIMSDLTFNDSKARNKLHWNPQKVLLGFRVK